jgi:hypothetical protein
MSSQVHVHSLEAVEAVRDALISFVDQVQQALDTLEAEMRRMLDWLEHDRPAYWRRQIRQAIDDVNEAQAALHQRLMFPIGDHRPSCREERAALKRAQDRLVYCQQKAEKVKHWVNVVRHELFEYEGRISQLARLVEIDGPHSIGVLGKIRDHISEYQAVRKSDSRASYEARALADEIWHRPLPKGEGTKQHPLPTEERTEQGPLPTGEGTGA